ncbi:MAG: hypothetical protein IT280_04880 [Ignavibacteria bacterium]|nr:hypothetical protein [Ignavibacteria bacterium]
MLMNIFDVYMRTCAMREYFEGEYDRIEKKKNKSNSDLKAMSFFEKKINQLAVKGDKYQEYFFGNIYE